LITRPYLCQHCLYGAKVVLDGRLQGRGDLHGGAR
jgi:hypothetical protein